MKLSVCPLEPHTYSALGWTGVKLARESLPTDEDPAVKGASGIDSN